jgi:hypothetical protein
MKTYTYALLLPLMVALSFNSFARGQAERKSEAAPFTSSTPSEYVHLHMKKEGDDVPRAHILKRITLGEQVSFNQAISEEERFVRHIHKVHGKTAAGPMKSNDSVPNAYQRKRMIFDNN